MFRDKRVLIHTGWMPATLTVLAFLCPPRSAGAMAQDASSPSGQPPPADKSQDEPKPLLPDVDKPQPKPDSDAKSPPKKKGAAGRIAEKQAAETAQKDPKMPEPRQPSKAFIEFTQPLGWPVYDAPNAGDKVIYALKMSDPKKRRDKATLTVSFVPERQGKASTVLKNWCEDFIKPDGTKPRLAEVAQEFEVNSLKVTLIELQGATKSGKGGKAVPGQMMIAAVVHHPEGPFFIRAEGKASTLEPQRERIEKFIRSVRPATPVKKTEGGDTDQPGGEVSGAAPGKPPPSPTSPETKPEPQPETKDTPPSPQPKDELPPNA